MGKKGGIHMEYFIILIIDAGLAFIPANIAKKKGYSFAGFWCMSFFLSFLIILIVAVCLSDKNLYVRREEVGGYTPGYAPPCPMPRVFDKYCSHCGKGLYTEDIFCAGCGANQQF